jgi:hypothetical protein
MAYAIIDLNTGETIDESAPLSTKPTPMFEHQEPQPELQLEIVQTEPPKRLLRQVRSLVAIDYKKYGLKVFELLSNRE